MSFHYTDVFMKCKQKWVADSFEKKNWENKPEWTRIAASLKGLFPKYGVKLPFA